jgi:phosphatidylinositol alpha-1,6-mannosyltransferase
VAEVTFISPYCRRAIYGSESILGTVISSGVDLERFSPRISGSHIRQRLNLSQETPVLFAVQRLSSEKRVDIVIRAMPHVLDKHPDVVLVIGGKGPDRSNLDSLLQELGLEQSIYFAGYIPNSDLPAYYAMADIFVFHSTYETFGIVIAEAMAGGKPVVSVRSTAISDVVQDGQTGLLAVPMSPIDMADKIIHLLNSPSKFQQFGQNGRLWAEQHFDWNVIVEQYEKILLKAAKS